METEMNAIVAVSDIEKMANAIAKSNFFGMKTPEQAMALMFIAQAEGRHPATAAQEYHVIQGKPALKADAMLARFQAAGGKVEWLSYTDKEVTGKFSHAQGGSVEISWTIEMAHNAKLTGKDTWKQYPRQMLRARVISEGIRTVYPGVAVGMYTPEEVGDFNDKPDMINVTPIPSAQSYDATTGEIAPAFRPSDPVRPYKDDYVVPAPIMPDGTLDFDEFTADLEGKLDSAENLKTVSLLNRANAKTLKVMQVERPDLFDHIGSRFREMTAALA
jgi:hypothetical protein